MGSDDRGETPWETARAHCAFQATRGATHGLRNALQVIRTYGIAGIPPGPGREAFQAGLQQTLGLLAALEGLHDSGSPEPAPEELTAAFHLLPELFLYSLREKGTRLQVQMKEKVVPGLLHWDLFLLVCLLLEEILEELPAGLPGTVRLTVDGDRLELVWHPEPGTLPFALPSRRPGDRMTALAARLHLDLRMERGGNAMRLRLVQEGRQGLKMRNSLDRPALKGQGKGMERSEQLDFTD